MRSYQRRQEVVLPLILDALTELASLELQTRLWTGSTLSEISSLGEAASALFDDSNLDIALRKNAITFSDEIDGDLRALDAELKPLLATEPHSSAAALISHPDMDRVRINAARIHDKLSQIAKQ